MIEHTIASRVIDESDNLVEASTERNTVITRTLWGSPALATPIKPASEPALTKSELRFALNYHGDDARIGDADWKIVDRYFDIVECNRGTHPSLATPTQPASTAERAEFEVWQGDGDETMMCASADGLRADAWKDVQHYAAQYAQDGPVRVCEVTRRWISPDEPASEPQMSLGQRAAWCARANKMLSDQESATPTQSASERDEAHARLVSAAESMIGYAEATISPTCRKRFDDHYVPRLRAAVDAVMNKEQP